MQSARRDPIPERLGPYDVRAKIGEGGMATVFLGRRIDAAPGTTDRERVVALKVIKDEFSQNHDFVNMFLDEAKIVSRLDHPNVVRVFDSGSGGPDGTRLYIAMELLFGQSLWHVWNACRERGVRIRYDIAAYIGARSAEGLHHAHELTDDAGELQNVVHRDLNASNVFVTYDGDVKIIDFGLAKAANRVSKTAAGIVKGKLAYMSPEQAVGKHLDRRSDVFALAITLWEVTVDRRLFKANDDIETLKRVYAADVPDPTKLVPGYPPALWEVLKRALSREPEDRYATAAEMAHDLDRVTHCEGRAINRASVSEVMNALFAEERHRHSRWIDDASTLEGSAPKETLRPQAMTTPPPALTPIPPPAAPNDSSLFAPSVPNLPEDPHDPNPSEPRNTRLHPSSAPPQGIPLPSIKSKAPAAPPPTTIATMLFAIAIAISTASIIIWLLRR